MTSSSMKRQCSRRQGKGKPPTNDLVPDAPTPGIKDVLNHSQHFSNRD